MNRPDHGHSEHAPLPARMSRAERLKACGITLTKSDTIRPAATYLVSEVATMMGHSAATIRRLIVRGKLEKAVGTRVVRITSASVVALLSAAASGPVNLARELQQHGSCLVLGPDDISKLYRIHIQTAYRLLARGTLKCLPWLTNRRVLKSEVSKAIGGIDALEITDIYPNEQLAMVA